MTFYSRAALACLFAASSAFAASTSLALTANGIATQTDQGITFDFNGFATLSAFGTGNVTGTAVLTPTGAAGLFNVDGILQIVYAPGNVLNESFHIPSVALNGQSNFTAATTTVTGGTGQFAGATGSFPTLSGSMSATQATVTSVNLSFSLNGTGDVTAAAFTGGIGGVHFVPVTPCRIADTRNANGTFGGPTMNGGSIRAFPIPASACNIPATAAAYSLNITVVPKGLLQYLTIWPTGEPQPFVSTLNSDGRIKANAAIVAAGQDGAVSVYVTDQTDVILDINGYFEKDFTAADLEFFPLPPCRISDTRNANGPLGGPKLAGGETRAIPIQSSSCGVPANASAYSLNITAVPSGPLGFLSTWPAGQPQPLVSTLNSPTGAIVANAAIVPAGTNGAIDVYVTAPTDVVIDINGYFAPVAQNGLSLYPVTPCRMVDTRNAAGPLGGPSLGDYSTRSFPLQSSSCGVPATVQAYSLNATVVPPGPLTYLTLWPTGQAKPFVSTLNDLDGAVTSNAAIVPAGTSGAVSAYVVNKTDLVLDVNGYFAP